MNVRGRAVASLVADPQTMRGVASLPQALRCWFAGHTAPRGAVWGARRESHGKTIAMSLHRRSERSKLFLDEVTP
jgi:hypothetical protein